MLSSGPLPENLSGNLIRAIFSLNRGRPEDEMSLHDSVLFWLDYGRVDSIWNYLEISSVFSGPTKHFPVVIVNQILKDVLTNYLQEEQYEPELCRQMAKTISEVYVWFTKC